MADVLNHLANNLPRRKFDAVIIGAGGAVQGIPNALAYGGGAGWHRRVLGQHERRQLVLAYV
jgi:hypothetical protein